MKTPANNLKVKVVLFFLLAIAKSGFSQEEVNVNLTPQKEYETVVTIRSACGGNKEFNIPMTLLWEENNETINITFKSDKSVGEKFIYSFPKKMFYKDVKKLRKEIWFDVKMLKKCKQKGVVDGSIVASTLVNAALARDNNVPQILELMDIYSHINYYIKAPVSNESNVCKIPINLYVASKEAQKGSLRVRKIEYLAKITLNITLVNICEGDDMNEIIETLVSKVESMQSKKETVAAELESLPELSCTKIKELKEISFGEEKEFHVKDPQYSGCENLMAAVRTYNETLEARNSVIRNYNDKLNEKKRACAGPGIDCKPLSQVNEKLAELLLDIKNGKKDALPALKQKYEAIKKTIANPDYKKCKDYKAFESLCEKIDNRLK